MTHTYMSNSFIRRKEKNVIAMRTARVLTCSTLPRLHPHRSFTFTGPSNHPLPGLYRHYKNGDVYKVLGSVLHTETGEAMILYHAVNPDEKARERNPHGMAFVRPSEMFIGNVEHQGIQVPRFQRLAVATPSADSFIEEKNDEQKKN